MNPLVDRSEIERAYEEDPSAARAEFGAEFRDDLEAFVSPEAVQLVTIRGRTLLSFEPGKRYSEPDQFSRVGAQLARYADELCNATAASLASDMNDQVNGEPDRLARAGMRQPDVGG